MTIEIPFSLARLLVAKREDVKAYEYEDIQDLAKSMLAVLIAAHDDVAMGGLASRKRRPKVKAVKAASSKKRGDYMRTAKARKAQSRRMKAYWRDKKRGK